MIARNTKDNANINNLFGQTISTFASIDQKGVQVAKSMIDNHNKQTVMDYINKTNATYGDFRKQPLNYFNTREEAMYAGSILNQKALEYQIESGYFEVNNLNSNSASDVDKAINDFYYKNQNEIINNF